VVAEINSLNGGTVATERLQDCCPYPRWESDHGVLEANMTVEVALLVDVDAPFESGPAAEGYPATAGSALLVVPLIKVSRVTRAAVELGQPPVVHDPADPVSGFSATGTS
jgi:hypothetical protein